MGHDKLRKFAENETFSCLLQPDARELLSQGYFNLQDHAIKGRWNRDMFHCDGQRDIVLELGCGKGEYTIDLALRKPECNFIGVDIKGARLWKGAKYATGNNLPNVAFLRTRVEFISSFFAQDEVSDIWLTFSDPQFRSENSRLSSPLFLERYRKFLKRGGMVHLKTDSRFLHEYTKSVCEANGLKIVACTTDLYGDSSLELADEVRAVQTFYEKLFLSQGYKITYLSFVIDHEGDYVHPADFDADYWRSVEGPRVLFGHDSAETRRQKLHNPNRHPEPDSGSPESI